MAVYEQREIVITMEELAVKYGKPRKELFKPLILARKILTNGTTPEHYTEWADSVKSLQRVLDNDDDRAIIYHVLATVIFKYEADINKNRSVDEVISDADLDSVLFYTHYYSDEMRILAIQAKAMDMLEKRNKLLMEIAEDKSKKPMTRIQALKAMDTYINSCLLPNAPGTINVYGQALIDASSNKQVKAFDLDKLMGQGDPEFRKYIKGKRELDEVLTIENESA